MNAQLKTALLITLALLTLGALAVALLYLRQRLFTNTEPIILSD